MVKIKGPIKLTPKSNLIDFLRKNCVGMNLPFSGTNFKCTKNQDFIDKNMNPDGAKILDAKEEPIEIMEEPVKEIKNEPVKEIIDEQPKVIVKKLKVRKK